MYFHYKLYYISTIKIKEALEILLSKNDIDYEECLYKKRRWYYNKFFALIRISIFKRRKIL